MARERSGGVEIERKRGDNGVTKIAGGRDLARMGRPER